MGLKNKRIGVLMGGWSPEREISLKSGRKVAESLNRQGFRVIEIDVGQGLASILRKEKIDIAFIALHGVPGEDGTVQGLLEILGIPYTGSGVLASAISMNKVITKMVLQANGIRVPRYIKFKVKSEKFKVDLKKVTEEIGSPPWIVKAVSGGSSVGVEIVKKPEDLESTFNKIKEKYQDAFIEEFIEGREITVGILGDEVLPVAELVPKSEFFDYRAKYTPGITEEIIPAQLPKGVYEEAQSFAIRSHRAIGCRGFSRVDMMVKDNKPCVLEVNSIPGLTDMSVLPMEAKHIGITYDEVIYRILESAIK